MLVLFISRTRLGKSLRAAADNPEAATYMGIDVDRAHRIAFGSAPAITAVAGGLVATYYPFQPYVGLEFVIIMYAGVVLGGMGSIIGAFWGGMTIGLVQQLSTLVLPTQLQNTAIFVVFLLIVLPAAAGLVRPQRRSGRDACSGIHVGARCAIAGLRCSPMRSVVAAGHQLSTTSSC